MTSVTLTGNLGPGRAVTSLVLDDARAVRFDLPKKVLEVDYYDEGPHHAEYDLADITAVTVTDAGNIITAMTFTNA